MTDTNNLDNLLEVDLTSTPPSFPNRRVSATLHEGEVPWRHVRRKSKSREKQHIERSRGVIQGEEKTRQEREQTAEDYFLQSLPSLKSLSSDSLYSTPNSSVISFTKALQSRSLRLALEHELDLAFDQDRGRRKKGMPSGRGKGIKSNVNERVHRLGIRGH
eukprot:TRINITY_DN79912_c0_g1_i1.p1 TRINITY_DN79912_c0_g1~~TRINITY_DN79912_c0_g1_i1.p1  ORF type:complete len:161 (+),score=1.67 TRINITY_DN79912_c0_g1_i1:33-515(+)